MIKAKLFQSIFYKYICMYLGKMLNLHVSEKHFFGEKLSYFRVWDHLKLLFFTPMSNVSLRNFSLQVHDIVRGFVSIDGVTTSCFTGFLF